MNASNPTVSNESVYRGADASKLLNAMPDRVADLVRRHAEQMPDHPALVSGDQIVTYAALWSAIGRAETLLRDAGVRPGDRVLVVCENSVSAAVFIFAATRLEAWACPINARMSSREIEGCRIFAGARVAIYSSGDSPAAAKHAVEAGAQLHNDDCYGTVAIGTTNPDTQPEPVFSDRSRQVAILLFSSGTTGQPKGVMLSHQAIMVLASGTAMLRNMQPDDRLYNVAPMSHIIGLGAMLLAAVWAGATAELVAQFKPDHLASAVREDRVSYIMGVPTIFARVLDYAKAHQISLNSKRLRYLAVGGMPLDSILKQQIEEAFGLTVGNSYGMTEICPVTRPQGTTVGDSVGQVQPGMELRLVREDGQDVAVGETGEIWAKGPNMMLGYYRDEQATESVRRPGGFITTGDLGRMDAHGNLTLVGRTKDLIIRSGFNVYPVEIESVLLKFPGVAFAAVVGRPVTGNEEIVAYVQPSPGRSIDVSEIEAWARENLSPYKRPAEIILTHELPIGPSGKIAKSKLKELWSGKA